MYKIGMFSSINKVTVKALRYYDNCGLLKPAYTDPYTGYRYYTSQQFPILHNIIALRQIGFSIEDIFSILNGRNLDRILNEKIISLKSDISEKKKQLKNLQHFISMKEEVFDMGYQIVLKELPGVKVYSKRLKIKDYNSYFSIIPKIGEEVLNSNPDIKRRIPEYCFIEYLDGEFKESDFNIEFCEAVQEFGEDHGNIRFKYIDPVPVSACVFHKGAYSNIGKAYAFIFNWINSNGYKALGNPRESFIDGIWNKENEEDWLTEIQIPVNKI